MLSFLKLSLKRCLETAMICTFVYLCFDCTWSHNEKLRTSHKSKNRNHFAKSVTVFLEGFLFCKPLDCQNGKTHQQHMLTKCRKIYGIGRVTTGPRQQGPYTIVCRKTHRLQRTCKKNERTFTIE